MKNSHALVAVLLSPILQLQLHCCSSGADAAVPRMQGSGSWSQCSSSKLFLSVTLMVCLLITHLLLCPVNDVVAKFKAQSAAVKKVGSGFICIFLSPKDVCL